MRALHRKLFRDLWRIKGQGLAIALVIAAGVAMFIMSLSTFDSLRRTQGAYYERYRFADVFAALERAPRRLEARLTELPGVRRAATRVVADVLLDVAGEVEPVVGRLISLPERADGGPTAALNGVALLRGRFPEPDRAGEAVVSEGFSLARGLGPGDAVTAVINGRRQDLEIVGVGLSPEYVYTIRPGELLPDEGRYGLFWMNREALATAFDMEGGFNDVALQLMPGASARDVVARLDRLLAPYGGLGSLPRDLQISHWYLDNELTALQTVGIVVPVIFLAVAAFLLNIVLRRIVTVQREQIAALKALGYSDFEVGGHYTGWALAIAVLGGLLGIAGGAWMGSEMIAMYNDFYRFPFLVFGLSAKVVLGAVAVSLAAAVLGAFGAVRRAVRLPPAEAMRPEPPASYRVSLVERLGLQRWLPQPARMIARNIERQPGRAAASVTGISFATAMMIVGLFSLDSLDEMLDLQFDVAQRQDVTINFVLPLSERALHAVERLPGVLHAESSRTVAVRLRFGHRSRQLAITGLAGDARLNRAVDASFRPATLPENGLVLSGKLAELLGARPGDQITVEVLEGKRPTRTVRVAGLVDEYMGTAAYMELGALNRLLREGGSLSGAYLQVDPGRLDELYRSLKGLPAVAAVALRTAALASFRDTIAENIGIQIFFNTLFAAVIAFGVIYNAARISLSERGRELASLRVLGFTRGEISFILLGELAVVTAMAIPFGLLLGYALAAVVVMAYDTELYRLPLVVAPATYAWAVLTVIVASVVSALAVQRKLSRLDLVEVLKTKE